VSFTSAGFDDLLGRARAGDVDAINELLAAFRPDIRQWIENECGNRAAAFIDVSGVTQVSLLCVHRELGDFRGTTTEEFRAWVKRISLNRLVDEIRANCCQKRDLRAVQSLETVDMPGKPLRDRMAADSSTPSVRVARNEQLRRAIEKLPRDQQAIAVGYFIDRLGIEAIAAKCEIPLEQAALSLEKAVRNLRKHLRPSD